MAYTLSPKLSDFRGYPSEYYEITKEEVFYRQNCPSNQSGSPVSFSKTYRSYVSNNDAVQKMENDAANFRTQGQANANSTGSCIVSPAPNSVNISGYLKIGEMSADNGKVYIVDKPNHCVVAYEDVLYGPLDKTDLEIKFGKSYIGVRGSLGTDEYRLNNPTRVDVLGYGCAVINDDGKEIKVFDLNLRQEDKVAPGRVVVKSPDIEYIHDVTLGKLGSNNIPLEIFFLARATNNDFNLYKVSYNNSNPASVTLLKTIFQFYNEISVIYASLDFCKYSNMPAHPAPDLLGTRDALGISIYSVYAAKSYHDTFVININDIDNRYWVPYPPESTLVRPGICISTDNASFGVDAYTIIVYNSFHRFNAGSGSFSVIQRLGNTGDYGYKDYRFGMDHVTYDKVLGVMYLIDVYRRSIYKTKSFHTAPAVVASDLIQ